MAATTLQRRTVAEEQLRSRRSDLDAAATVRSLSDGLDLLANLLFDRVDRDVEQNFGVDSMLMPPSTQREIEATTRAHTLIDVYSAVVAAEEAVQRGYIDDANWFVQWLLDLRLDDPADDVASRAAERAKKYQGMQPDERRLKFASSLERRVPNAVNAPLVTYRLYPLGVRMVVAIAFGDNFRAGELRNQQASLLPVISDCHSCHGNPLDNGERCEACSNPLWGYEWLTAD